MKHFGPVTLATPFFILAVILEIGLARFANTRTHYEARDTAASLMMGMVGMVAGLWAEKFDHLAAVTTFIVMPLTMLSGTFYTVDRLPLAAQIISHYNPFYYAIAGFRYGIIGLNDGSLGLGVVVVAAPAATPADHAPGNH